MSLRFNKDNKIPVDELHFYFKNYHFINIDFTYMLRKLGIKTHKEFLGICNFSKKINRLWIDDEGFDKLVDSFLTDDKDLVDVPDSKLWYQIIKINENDFQLEIYNFDGEIIESKITTTSEIKKIINNL